MSNISSKNKMLCFLRFFYGSLAMTTFRLLHLRLLPRQPQRHVLPQRTGGQGHRAATDEAAPHRRDPRRGPLLTLICFIFITFIFSSMILNWDIHESDCLVNLEPKIFFSIHVAVTPRYMCNLFCKIDLCLMLCTYSAPMCFESLLFPYFHILNDIFSTSFLKFFFMVYSLFYQHLIFTYCL